MTAALLAIYRQYHWTPNRSDNLASLGDFNFWLSLSL